MSSILASPGFRLTLAGALIQILSPLAFRWGPILCLAAIGISLGGLVLCTKASGTSLGIQLTLAGALIQIISPLTLDWSYLLNLAGIWVSLGGLMLIAKSFSHSPAWPAFVLVLIIGPLLWMTLGVGRQAVWPIEVVRMTWVVPILGIFLLDSQTEFAALKLSEDIRELLVRSRHVTQVQEPAARRLTQESSSIQSTSWQMRTANSVLFVVLALAPTTCVFQGAQLYSAEWKAARGDYFYVPFAHTGDRDYVKVGSFYFLSGAVGIAAFAYLSFGKRRLFKILATVGLMGAFAVRMVPAFVWATPEYDMPIHARSDVGGVMGQTYTMLLKSANASGHFPRSEEEFLKEIQKEVAQHDTLSRYAHGGNLLPYRFVFVQGATGPYFPEPPGPAPAIIYCALSSDSRKLWLTGTVLLKLVDDRVNFLPGRYADHKGARELAGKYYLTGEVPSP